MKITELAHHGILGMKWGVRRYTNPDGSLTEEGKIRYGSASKDEMLRDLNRMQATEKKAKGTAVAVGAAAVAALVGAGMLQKKLADLRALSRMGSPIVSSMVHVNNIEYMLK